MSAITPAQARDYLDRTKHDTSQMGDMEVLQAYIGVGAVERNHLQAQIDRMIREENDASRASRTALRREAEQTRSDWEKAVRRAFHGQYLEPLNTLAYQASILPERPKKADLDPLRSAAPECLRMLREPPQNADTRLLTQQNAEIQRLRGLILDAGRREHAEGAPKTGTYCKCHGCELIRNMDDLPLPASPE